MPLQTTISFHNTTNLQGIELQENEGKALKQDEVIEKVFRSTSHMTWTPERMLRHLCIMESLNENRWSKTPITSVRRSFSNLKNKGLIEKTDDFVLGDYGKKVHLWRLCQ